MPAAAARSSSNPGVACASSFGMSGVNAHMLLSAVPSEGSSDAAGGQPLPWQRQRHWPAAAPHPLLQLASMAGSTVQFSCSFAGGASAFLRDHCISGRLLVPATAFFELLLAAVSSAVDDSSKKQLLPSLAGVAIQAPKILAQAAAAASDAVQVSLQLSSGAAEVLSADGTRHVRGSVCAAPAAPAVLEAVASGSSGAARQLVISSLASGGTARRYNFAAISSAAACPSGSGWHAQPAASDAALHLAAVKVAGLGDGASRVPVAVAAVAAAAASSSGAQQWSGSGLPVVAADRSALCTVRAQLAGSSFAACGLHSRLLPSKPAGAPATDAAAAAKAFEQRNFTYAIQWQAAAEAAVAPCTSLVPVASSSSLRLLADAPAAGQDGLPAALSLARQLAIVAGRRSPSSPATAAAGTIEMLQRILAADGTATVHAVTTAASPSPAAAHTCTASDVLAAALKVAAVECPSRHWGATLVDSQQQQQLNSGCIPMGAADQHGALLSAGALCHPKLLRQPM